jgi:hypothetical protein
MIITVPEKSEQTEPIPVLPVSAIMITADPFINGDNSLVKYWSRAK